jgi:hypothetical protein
MKYNGVEITVFLSVSKIGPSVDIFLALIDNCALYFIVCNICGSFIVYLLK